MPENLIIDMSVILGILAAVLPLMGVMWVIRKMIKSINRS